eukprot:3211100-Rhodomonas_salina.1
MAAAAAAPPACSFETQQNPRMPAFLLRLEGAPATGIDGDAAIEELVKHAKICALVPASCHNNGTWLFLRPFVLDPLVFELKGQRAMLDRTAPLRLPGNLCECSQNMLQTAAL